MICEGYLSHKFNGLAIAELEELVAVFNKHYPHYAFDSSSYTELFDFMRNDKKNESQKLGFSLLSEIGVCTYNSYLSEADIAESMDYYRALV